MDFSTLPQELCGVIWAEILRRERESIRKYFVKKVLRQLKREHEKDDQFFVTGRCCAKGLTIKRFTRTETFEVMDPSELNDLFPDNDDFNSRLSFTDMMAMLDDWNLNGLINDFGLIERFHIT
jgi:hypothetical protein